MMRSWERNNELDYIKAIAEVHSISVAADNLGISQPALSAYLKKKEQELGVTIFDRSRKPLQLTEEGKVYLEYLEHSAALEHEFLQKIDDMANLQRGKLTVGGASYFNITYLPKAIAAFSAAYPHIDVEIVDDKVPELITEAWNGSLDLFITPSDHDKDRFCYSELLEETLYLAVPEEWDINDTLPEVLTQDDFRRLCEYPFVVLKPNQDIGRKMEELFQHFGCRPEHVITAEQTMTTLAMTKAGAGVSMISRSKVEEGLLIKPSQLHIADERLCRRKLFIAYPKNKYLSNAAKAFIAILKEVNRRNEAK